MLRGARRFSRRAKHSFRFSRIGISRGSECHGERHHRPCQPVRLLGRAAADCRGEHFSADPQRGDPHLRRLFNDLYGDDAPGVILFSTLGSVAGAIVLYGVGRLLAPQRLEALLSGRVGRVLKMESADVHKASDWFAAHGWPSVFYCRCIPILRSLISIPAGMAGMHPAPFLLLTTVGSLLWNILLVYLGALAGQSWPAVTAALEQASGWVKAVLVVACAAGVSALFYGRRKKREAARQCAVPEREETQKEKISRGGLPGRPPLASKAIPHNSRLMP